MRMSFYAASAAPLISADAAGSFILASLLGRHGLRALRGACRSAVVAVAVLGPCVLSRDRITPTAALHLS